MSVQTSPSSFIESNLQQRRGRCSHSCPKQRARGLHPGPCHLRCRTEQSSKYYCKRYSHLNKITNNKDSIGIFRFLHLPPPGNIIPFLWKDKTGNPTAPQFISTKHLKICPGWIWMHIWLFPGMGRHCLHSSPHSLTPHSAQRELHDTCLYPYLVEAGQTVAPRR